MEASAPFEASVWIGGEALDDIVPCHLLDLTAEKLTCGLPNDECLHILYTAIASLKRKVHLVPTEHGPLHCVRVATKQFRYFNMYFRYEQDVNDLHDTLLHYAFPENFERLYAFHLPTALHPRSRKGWSLYNAESEYERQGIGTKTNAWRFTTINKEFGFCGTYPKVLVVPAKISDTVLTHAAKFRSKNRVPVLSYYHTATGTTITRSAQPFVGLKMKRSIQDEKLVEAIFLSAAQTSAPITENLILDPRPLANAMANQALGAGFENPEYYGNCRRLFMGIDNIHVVRESQHKLVNGIREATEMLPLTETAPSTGGPATPQTSRAPPSSSPQLSFEEEAAIVENAKWSHHIQMILTAACTTVRAVHFEKANVLVHCSDGWDRTSQCTALAMLCLDPYYRTFEGFMVLIEKEWCSFGHKFRERCGHLLKKSAAASSFNPSSMLMQAATGGTGAAAQEAVRNGGNTTVHNATTSNGGGLEASLFLGSAAASSAGAGIANFFKPASPATSLAVSHTAYDDGPAPAPYMTNPKEASPIFTQFLECVAILLKRYPTAFAFNESMLVILHDEVYNCRFGTFLTNHEWEKESCRIPERTQSVWDYFFDRKASFVNQAYQRDENVLDVRIDPRVLSFGFWKRLYLRWTKRCGTSPGLRRPFHNGYALPITHMETASAKPLSGESKDCHKCARCKEVFLFYDLIVIVSSFSQLRYAY